MRFELFDLEADLGERVNLASREPELPERLARRLQAELIGRSAQRPVDEESGEPVPRPAEALVSSDRPR